MFCPLFFCVCATLVQLSVVFFPFLSRLCFLFRQVWLHMCVCLFAWGFDLHVSEREREILMFRFLFFLGNQHVPIPSPLSN